jgi:hypothetical protein
MTMDRTDAIYASIITGIGAVAAFAYGNLFGLICCVAVLESIAAIVLFQIVTQYWQIRFRRMGRDLPRYKSYGTHWFLGMVVGASIMFGTIYASWCWTISSISLDDIICMRGGLVHTFGIMIFAIFGMATGWALIQINARVANHLNRKAGRRPTFTV